jgi:hypothetical protein
MSMATTVSDDLDAWRKSADARPWTRDEDALVMSIKVEHPAAYETFRRFNDLLSEAIGDLVDPFTRRGERATGEVTIHIGERALALDLHHADALCTFLDDTSVDLAVALGIPPDDEEGG